MNLRAVRLAGWPALSRITVHVNSDFRQNNIFLSQQSAEQYFGLFFSPAEHALKLQTKAESKYCCITLIKHEKATKTERV